MAVRRELFEQLGPWNHAVGRRGDERGTFEDTELQDRAHAAGGVVWFCAAARLRHRIDRSVVTRREIVLRAFARGGYDRRIETVQGRNGAEGPMVAELATAIASAAALFAWELTFRLMKTRRVFKRLHHAALRAGRSLEGLEARRRGDARGELRSARTMRRMVWISRRFIADAA
jgi:hypothetical protein